MCTGGVLYQSRFLEFLNVWQDLERDLRQRHHTCSNSTEDMRGTLDRTNVLMYATFSVSKTLVLRRPLRLRVAISSLPKIHSLAKAVLRIRRLATSLPLYFPNTSSTVHVTVPELDIVCCESEIVSGGFDTGDTGLGGGNGESEPCTTEVVERVKGGDLDSLQLLYHVE